MNRDLLIKYLRTPAGCDGGNINGNNWLFSIEYSGTAQASDYDNLVIDANHGFVPEEEVAKFEALTIQKKSCRGDRYNASDEKNSLG
ncbi:MAG: hypothetical protein ACC707_18155 [Thiohalomonadales bacterium]